MSDSINSNVVTLGGRQFVASCLPLGVFRRNTAAIRTILAMRGTINAANPLPTEEQLSAIITIVGLSVAPVDTPDAPIGVETLERLIDGKDWKKGLVELMNALKAVMSASGYEESSETGSGEAGSAAPST